MGESPRAFKRLGPSPGTSRVPRGALPGDAPADGPTARPALCYRGRMSDERDARDDSEAAGAQARRATFGETVSAVLWSFFGVRKGKDLRRDAATLNPVYLILTGIGLAALIVVGLLVLVHFIVH